MRRILLCLLAAVFAAPPAGALPVSVKQLERKIASLREPDAATARDLGVLQLTERLNWASFKELEKQLPGEQSREALLAIADASQFLPPPRDEGATQNPPSRAEQQHLLEQAQAYVRSVLPQRPNFVAVRHILRFQDRGADYQAQSFTPADEGTHEPPMLPVAKQTDTLRYVDGQETQSEEAKSNGFASGIQTSLDTTGTFGAILGTILADTTHLRARWMRWEHTPEGTLAVFRFDVPKNHSHYEVNYCCVSAQMFTHVDPATGVFHDSAGYRAEIAVEPETGVIVRLALDAPMSEFTPLRRVAVLVEYAPMTIAGKSYICPVHSVTITSAPVAPQVHMWSVGETVDLRRVNVVTDTRFTGYKRFAGEMRIVKDVPQGPPAQAPR
jgi:hypothetical protein